MIRSLTAFARRAASKGERGTTLVETVVTMMILAIAAAIFLNSLASVQTAVGREDNRSTNNDQVRLALEELDREVRSGDLLYDPAAENSTRCGGYTCAPYYALRVYTQVNGATRTPSHQCVQWIIQNDQLMRRAWQSGASASFTGWRVVATGIVNRSVSPAVHAFSIDPNSGSRTIDVTFVVNGRLGDPNSTSTTMQTSISIRNAFTGAPCDPIPTS